VSLVLGTGDAVQSLPFDQIASAVPVHVALAARDVAGAASAVASPKLKARRLGKKDPLKDKFVIFIGCLTLSLCAFPFVQTKTNTSIHCGFN